MEALYICSYKQTKSVLKDFFAYTFYKSRGVRLLYAALLVCAALIAYTWVNTGKPGDGIIILPGALIVQYFLFLKTSSSTYDKSKKADGTECTETVELYEDKLTVRTDMGMNESYEYGRLKELFKSGRLLLLKTSGGAYIVLESSSFIRGTSEEAVEFLRSKGVEIK